MKIFNLKISITKKEFATMFSSKLYIKLSFKEEEREENDC